MSTFVPLNTTNSLMILWYNINDFLHKKSKFYFLKNAMNICLKVTLLQFQRKRFDIDFISKFLDIIRIHLLFIIKYSGCILHLEDEEELEQRVEGHVALKVEIFQKEKRQTKKKIKNKQLQRRNLSWHLHLPKSKQPFVIKSNHSSPKEIRS